MPNKQNSNHGTKWNCNDRCLSSAIIFQAVTMRSQADSGRRAAATTACSAGSGRRPSSNSRRARLALLALGLRPWWACGAWATAAPW
jgi:hypothetical protein